ncbi:hypothetical protein BACUNI_01585 [Bacteroides uniformis ATCC 8492]|uniref:Uncharacterized protein n=1 Tax=Bacteroides uniformis (strain ATCC 8492 / DSM 6597 / CCUG 4942 / CIP 103695 / JCM 5828 / KCTC 5204 / NCTC 13054 / VPI 0061) TaxID=411479 RepID=A0ABC9NDN4_BACUC|nr:hypothetical protein BACUNI_01585 [Bacteroides uniformis ATCC 8492]
MNNNEQREAHNELQGTNQECFHLIICCFTIFIIFAKVRFLI